MNQGAPVMRSRYAASLVAVAAMAVLSLAADSPIRFPKLPAAPTPVQPPDARTILKKGQRYIIDSDVQLFLRPVPATSVTWTEKTGPITIIGEFVDKPGVEDDERTFTGKFVYVIKPNLNGPSDLIVVPKGTDKDSDILTKLLEVQDGTKPQPPPKPDPTPTPKPEGTSPFPSEGLRVLIVYEKTTAVKPLTTEQLAMINGPKMRDYLDANCAKVAGWPQYSIVDQNQDLGKLSGEFATAAKRDRKSIPWVLIGNGKTGYEGPLPATEQEFLDLLKKYEVTK